MTRPILPDGQPYPRKRPINWAWIKRSLANRRFAVARHAEGYRQHETDWEIHRGCRMGEVIVDAQISPDGMYVWTKIGPKP
jgi:hypothetical protein